MFGPCPYVGVQLDAKSWDVAGPLIFLDMPFSAVMDTVLLPFDLASGNSCSGW
ncbi:YceK/YidQ family lipoprotein [Pseudomonas nitroreducens]